MLFIFENYILAMRYMRNVVKVYTLLNEKLILLIFINSTNFI